MLPLAYTMQHVDTDARHAAFRLKRRIRLAPPVMPSPVVSIYGHAGFRARQYGSRLDDETQLPQPAAVYVFNGPEYPRVLLRRDWT